MEQGKKGKLFVVVAPSGTGKSTLIAKLLVEIPQLEWSVSYTTRPQRPGEVHGKNYFFVTKDEFQKRIEQDDFLEWAQVHSNYYGTSKEVINTGLIQGKFLLFDLDVQGADSVKELYPADSVVIFIEPPSVDELENRLRSRGTETDEVIAERVNNARKELLKKHDYDYLLLNNDIDEAFHRLKGVILKEIGN